MKKAVLLCFISIFLVACAYPKSQIAVKDPRPTISVSGAPADAVLYVDGLDMGEAALYDGVKKTLLLEPGMHHIEVKLGGNTLLSRKAFLDEGAHKEFNLGGTGR